MTHTTQSHVSHVIARYACMRAITLTHTTQDYVSRVIARIDEVLLYTS